MPFDADARRALLERHANDWLRVGIENLHREFPHKPNLIITEPGPIRTHRECHPVFFGSFDWHSCVEMYWMMVRIMKLVPGLPNETAAREAIETLLTEEGMAQELATFRDPSSRSMERPYGWGWYLTFVHELATWDDGDAGCWLERSRPLADHFTAGFVQWLPKLHYPQRFGMHANTAFGLARSWGWAGHLTDQGDDTLREAIREAALRYFAADTDYPAHYEPSGADFLSGALTEAELMSLVLQSGEFPAWLERFLPGIHAAQPDVLFHPVVVTDTSDGQLAHLEGLNLSRAAAFVAIADALPVADVRIDPMLDAAERHADASLGQASGSNYMVEHWLATYAVLLLGQ
ncbi:MAG TPA: DUF2891 domain-containing protein [Thermomicrobiales bacterium]|nr:DUF2891 domain-containing protein [Thermomicrobiales bacterium]